MDDQVNASASSLLDAEVATALVRLRRYAAGVSLERNEVPLVGPHLPMLDQLSATGWQLITGRRGTGKTHLASRFAMMMRSSERGGPHAIAISAERLLVSPVGVDLTIRQRARSSLQVFLRIIADSLLDDLEELSARASRRSKRSASLGDDAARALIQMVEAAEEGYALTAAGARTFEQLIDHQTTREHNREMGAKLTAGVSDLGSSFTAGARRARSTVNSDSAKAISSYPAAALLSGISHPLEVALAILGVDHLFICLDSFTSLGIDGLKDVQARFLWDLRRALAPTPRVSLKLFANPYQLQLNSENGEGDVEIRLGEDVDHVVHLDKLLRESDLGGLAAIVEAHLQHLNPALTASKFRLELLFESFEAYELLLRGFGTNLSHGLSALRKLSIRHLPTSEQPWRIHQVQDVVGESLRMKVAAITPTRRTILSTLANAQGMADTVRLGDDLAEELRTDLLDLAERGLISPVSSMAWLHGPREVSVPQGVVQDATRHDLRATHRLDELPTALRAVTADQLPLCPNCESESLPATSPSNRLVCRGCYADLGVAAPGELAQENG